MDIVLLAGRLLLGAIFSVAGLAKLIDHTGSRQALVGFGVPERWARRFGLLLPIAELSIAISLIPVTTARLGMLGALILLIAFIAGIAGNLARGKHPDCHCFGQLHSAPAGWPTLGRNALLLTIAAILLWQGWNDPGVSAVGWLGGSSAGMRIAIMAAIAGVVIVLIEGWLLFHLIRQHGRLLLRLDALESRFGADGSPSSLDLLNTGLPLGVTAPAFSLADLHGETLSLNALRASAKPVLLLFSDPNCGPCTALMPDVGRWQLEYGSVLTVALISRGTTEANRVKTAEHGIDHVLLQQDREVARAYRSNGTPSAVLVHPDGTVGSPLAAGADAIRDLVAQAVLAGGRPLAFLPSPSRNGKHGVPQNGRQADPAGPRVGESAPDLQLPDLAGRPVALSGFRGEPVLVLFWNPGCGFCRQMLDDLKAWEANRTQGAPNLLVVSTGDQKANEEMALSSMVVLDAGFVTGRTFGASGTPSAVLVDAEGNIASGVAVGAAAIWELAGIASRPSLKVRLA